MVVDLTVVLESGNRRGEGVPRDTRRSVRVSRGTDVTVRVRALDASGAPLDLTPAGTSLLLAISRQTERGWASIRKTATLPPGAEAGEAQFLISASEQTVAFEGACQYEVFLLRGAVKDSVLPLSEWFFAPSFGPTL